MARIRPKKKKNSTFYYLVESRRSGPNNSPREHILEYIGTVDNLVAFINKQLSSTAPGKDSSSSGTTNITFKSYEHGAEIALYKTAQLLGIEQIFDQCFKQRKLKGLNRSRILLLAMIHRMIDPGSKNAFSEWAKKTSLPYHLRFNPEDLSSQTIWEAMDGITWEQIEKAQELLTKRALEVFPTELTNLHLDYTNYFTFIDSFNNRCDICRRGHNKQKRDDLRQFSLALITSAGLQIPLVWELYDGNKNDKMEFADFTAFAAKAMKAHGINDPKSVILTFDGGSNSEANFAALPFSFICAHTMTSFPDLYETDLDMYQELTLRNGHTRCAYEIPELTFSGVSGKGVLTFSQALYDGQLAELEKDIKAFSDACADIVSSIGHARGRYAQMIRKARMDHDAEVLRIEKYNSDIRKDYEEKVAKGIRIRGKQKQPKPVPTWDEASVAKELILSAALKGRKDLQSFVDVSVVISDDSCQIPKVVWGIDNEKKTAYIRKYFGKKLITTNRNDLSMLDILSTYAEQECIENLFKVSKNTDHFSIRPQFHWTDQKIRVHVMICLMGIAAVEVLRRKTKEAGLEYSKEALIDKLASIRDGWVIRDMKKAERVLEDMDEEQHKLMEIVEKLNAT